MKYDVVGRRALLIGLLAGSSLTLADEPVSLAMSDLAYWDEVPLVMSATRIAQPVVDAPWQ